MNQSQNFALWTELQRNEENVWELVSDSREQPALGERRIVCLLSELMGRQKTFIGTPTELSKQIDPAKP